MPEDRKLLEPMATVVSITLRILLGLMTVGVILNIVRGSWGSGSVCITDQSSSSSTEPGGFSAASGAVVNSIPEYCSWDPDAQLRLLDTFGELPGMLLLISGLFLLHRLLQGAARDGIYTARTASQLHLLGWWLLLGSLVAAVGEAAAQAGVLARLAQDVEFTAGAWLNEFSMPWLAVLTGLGLLTFARITRAGVAMREDLEGVV